LRFANYLDVSALPKPPASTDYSAKASAALARMYKNDVLGCCVVAAGDHLEGVATGNATGTPWLASDAQVVHDYSAIGGYVPGQPSTDQGCNEEDAFAYWGAHGFANGTKLAGYIAIDATNKAQCEAALWLFESAFFGVGLPDAWVDPFPSGPGFVWDVAGQADDNNGHAFLGVGYGTRGMTISTWGMLGTITWAAIARYAQAQAGGQLFALLTPDMLAKGQTKAPNGFAWADLIADFDAMGGHVPQPPAPPPVPPPAHGPSLAEATAAAAKALAALPNWPT
jgi:hypothetical protein